MRHTLITLFGIVFLFFAIFLVNEFDSRNWFNYTIKLKLNQKFKIKFYENGSTGYSNCWINKNKCNAIKFISKSYTSSFRELYGYIGAGGTISLNFRAIKIGKDTIKISNCPTGRENKDCNQFSEDSTEIDYYFPIEVE